MFQVPSSKKGFTLTELVVSIGILALVVGASIPAFRNIGKDRQLELIAEEVKDAIVLARTSVLAPDRSKSATALQSFKFKVLDNKTYTVTDCGPLPACEGGNEILRKTLPQDLIFTSIPPAIEFEFEEQGEPTNEAIFQIKSQSRNKSRTIKVSLTGTIEITE